MEKLSAEIMAILVPAITTVIGILVTWGLAELRKYIKTKTDNEAAVQAFDTLSGLVKDSVTALNQTTRTVFEDGKLSTAEKRQYKTLVMSQVLGQLPAATKKILDRNVADLGVFVDSRIESEVHYSKLINPQPPKREVAIP